MKRQRCGYASKYKATRPPTCGCKTCEDMWANRPIKREPVRTSFDRVFPGMPPAVKLSA